MNKLTNSIQNISLEQIKIDEATDCYGLYPPDRVISPQYPVVVRRNGPDGAEYQEAAAYNFLVNSPKFPGLANCGDGRLALTLSVDLADGRKEMILFSDDSGASWSRPERIALTRCRPVSLGGENILIYNSSELSISDDGGLTWSGHEPIPKLPDGRAVYTDVCCNPLVEGDTVTFIFYAPVEPAYSDFGKNNDEWMKGEIFSQAVLWKYNFRDHFWHTPYLFPQEWGLCEGSIARAPNGDLVIAFRTQMPGVPIETDHLMGMATSVSSDDGATWSEPAQHFHFGCHHCSLANLGDGRLLMTYAARIGELDGKTYHGFEAVFSGDNGVSWDWDHRVILYRCPSQSPHSPQSVCLPDGRILTVIMHDTSFSWTEDGKPAYPKGKNFTMIGNVVAVIWRP